MPTGTSCGRVGANQVCRCPFHEERTGSFTVYPDGGFNCFGCGVAGDVFAYIQRRDDCDFLTAKGKVAALAGMEPGMPRLVASEPARKRETKPVPWKPYAMNEGELASCVTMAEALVRSEKITEQIASARSWSAKPRVGGE